MDASAWPSSARSSSRRRRRVLDLLAPGFAERAGELGLDGRGARLPRRAAHARRARGAARPRRRSEARRASGRISTRSRSSRATRDLRSFGSQGEQRLAVLSLLLAEADLIAETRPSPPLLLLDDVLSELDPGRREILAARVAGRGPDGDHDDLASGAAGRAGAGGRGLARDGAGRLMERIGEDVERQLGRFDGGGAMPRIVAAWPAAVGDEVARNAWPARVARDGTLHVHTSSSVWAFELGQLAPRDPRAAARRARRRARRRRSGSPRATCPSPLRRRCRSAPGPRSSRRAEAVARGRVAGRRDRRRGAPRAGRESGFAGPRQGPRRPLVLIHLQQPANRQIAGLFS